MENNEKKKVKIEFEEERKFRSLQNCLNKYEVFD